MSIKKLEGFTEIFLPLLLPIISLVIIQQFLTSDFFEGTIPSIAQVVVFTTAIYFGAKRLAGNVSFEGAPDSHGVQKKYTATKFVYVVTFIGLVLNIWAVLS